MTKKRRKEWMDAEGYVPTDKQVKAAKAEAKRLAPYRSLMKAAVAAAIVYGLYISMKKTPSASVNASGEKGV